MSTADKHGRVLLEADTYVAANLDTGERARIVATVQKTCHGANCVCVSCLAARSPGAYSNKPSRHGLTSQQTQLLNRFTNAWNKDRAVRGLAPMLADDVLTRILQSATELVK